MLFLLFTFCFLLQILKGLYYVFFIIRPVVALAHHGFQRLFCTLWWILILLEQSLHHHSHFRPRRFLAVPVDGAVAVQYFRQFPSQRHKLLVGVSLPHSFGRGERIIECLLLGRKSQVVALCLCLLHLLSHLQQFLYHFLVGEQALQISWRDSG